MTLFAVRGFVCAVRASLSILNCRALFFMECRATIHQCLALRKWSTPNRRGHTLGVCILDNVDRTNWKPIINRILNQTQLAIGFHFMRSTP